MVTKKVVWPHEVVDTTHAQTPVYSEMGRALFVNGFLTLLADEYENRKPVLLQHLQEIMEDSEIYGWRTVRDYQLPCCLDAAD